MTSQNIDLSSWDTLYTINRIFVSHRFGYQPGSGKEVIELHFLQPRGAGPLKNNIMFHKKSFLLQGNNYIKFAIFGCKTYRIIGSWDNVGSDFKII
jgi:hypothetical protein